ARGCRSRAGEHDHAARRGHRLMAAANLSPAGLPRHFPPVPARHMKRDIAHRYDETDEAPVIVSSGEGDVAALIQRAAVAHAVPIVRDVPLADALAELRVGDPIPEALYEAVAAILRELVETTHV